MQPEQNSLTIAVVTKRVPLIPAFFRQFPPVPFPQIFAREIFRLFLKQPQP